MSRIYVPIQEDVRLALINLAVRELRSPREQAALIIRQELKRRGLLAEDEPKKGVKHVSA